MQYGLSVTHPIEHLCDCQSRSLRTVAIRSAAVSVSIFVESGHRWRALYGLGCCDASPEHTAAQLATQMPTAARRPERRTAADAK